MSNEEFFLIGNNSLFGSNLSNTPGANGFQPQKECHLFTFKSFKEHQSRHLSLNSMSLFEGFLKHFERQTTFATFEAEKNKFD